MRMNLQHQAILIVILACIVTSQAFIHTSPFLAWSTEPEAHLSDLLTGNTLLDDDSSQLNLAPAHNFLCPSRSSALAIFLLTSNTHHQSLQKGFLSPRVNKDYNSAPSSARVWTNNRPTSENDEMLLDLVDIWKHNCQGRIEIEEISANGDISSAYERIVNGLPASRLVVFTVAAPQDVHQLQKRRLAMSKAFKETSPSTMPSSKTGVFWRYQFLSDYLIVGILVMTLLFIPPVVIGSYALLSIEAPQGLKTKMMGAIAEVKGT